MDSVTQFALGASIGEAALGRKIGNRAALAGGIVATLPDLDSFIPYD
ncbi:MAG: metal-dependent hydrolase, partial [Gammaproteobacteria bacterium]|nr:metal-dependent hydrolase [Gammaproteobacteria bacterium]